jgi:cytochrome c biogenesis factor
MINNGVNIIMMLYLIIIGQLLLIKLQKNNEEKLIKNENCNYFYSLICRLLINCCRYMQKES